MPNNVKVLFIVNGFMGEQYLKVIESKKFDCTVFGWNLKIAE